MNNLLIVWDPLLPILALRAMAGVGVLVMALGALSPRLGIPAPGTLWRAGAALGILIALANPSLVVEDRAWSSSTAHPASQSKIAPPKPIRRWPASKLGPRVKPISNSGW
jgi:hypothetical protein